MKALITMSRQWWQSITQREQRLLMVGALFVLLGCLFWGIIQPLASKSEIARARLASEQQLLGWVQGKADSIIAARGSNGGATVSNTPINQVVNSSARQFNIELIRVQSRNDTLQVWVQPIAFNQLLNWFAFLKQQHGVEVAFLDIEDSDRAGVIEVNRLQFSR